MARISFNKFPSPFGVCVLKSFHGGTHRRKSFSFRPLSGFVF